MEPRTLKVARQVLYALSHTPVLLFCFQDTFAQAGRQWLTPIILATQEAEIRRIEVQSQPWQIVQQTLSQKNLHK
jgi:hypothetical protein